MTNEYFIIKLPTNPYILKFLQSIYGSMFILSMDDPLGMFIAGVMDKNVYPDKNRVVIYRAFCKYTHHINIYVSRRWLIKYYYGTDLEDKKVVFINKFLQLFFERELNLYCETMKAVRIDRQTALEQFLQKHNILEDEDITKDNIVKIEYRYRQKQLKKQQPSSAEKYGVQKMMM